MLVGADDGVDGDSDVGDAPSEGSDVGEGDVDAGPSGPGDEGDDLGEGDDVDVPPPACIPALEVCDGRDNDCDDQTDPGGTCAADCVGFTLGEHGYMYCAESLLRAAVLGRCEGEGMHLAWLETPEESGALRDEIMASGLDAPPDNDEILTQIGGSDAAAEGEWFWVGNGAVAGSFQFWTGGSAAQGGAAVDGAHAPWSPGEPTGLANEHCAAISVLGGAEHDPGAWDDRSCNEPLPFVCESP
jgi:hypothetical protein